VSSTAADPLPSPAPAPPPLVLPAADDLSARDAATARRAAAVAAQRSLFSRLLASRIHLQRAAAAADALPSGSAAAGARTGPARGAAPAAAACLAALISLADAALGGRAGGDSDGSANDHRPAEALAARWVGLAAPPDPDDLGTSGRSRAATAWAAVTARADAALPFARAALDKWGARAAVARSPVAAAVAARPPSERAARAASDPTEAARARPAGPAPPGGATAACDRWEDGSHYASLLSSYLSEEGGGAAGGDAGATAVARVAPPRSSGRDVDRRASKGRRARHAVVAELVGFLAPELRADGSEEGRGWATGRRLFGLAAGGT